MNSWLPSILALVAASAAATFSLAAGAGQVPASGAALIVVAVPTLLAPIFWPRGDASARSLLVCVAAPVVTAALLSIAWRIVQGRPVPMDALARAGLVSLVILFLARVTSFAAGQVLCRVGADARTAREWSLWGITSVLWLAAGAPLWLGPLADLGARLDAAIPSVILACSPLAHLAVASGYDLLRSPWFYGHTSLGALQVDYPRVSTLLLAYAGAGALVVLATIPFGRRPNDTSTV